ncbi:BrnA antitoxin family protein [Shinella zoogloeoides]|uniref:BrnA antitoxin family protein n=1 Tax=Shinella zoogloeoides TaxID=352475 RepID=UPI0028B011B2|nr:BrnA antitoxin family protein [Shinella zoogloeoides]
MTNKFSSKRPLTQEEEAEIQKMIAADPDNPELTEEQLAKAKPFAEVFPGMAKAMEREVAKRGRPRADDPREAVTLRLPRSVLERWKRDPDWRTKMVEALKRAAG